jgi:hypothetical protein
MLRVLCHCLLVFGHSLRFDGVQLGQQEGTFVTLVNESPPGGHVMRNKALEPPAAYTASLNWLKCRQSERPDARKVISWKLDYSRSFASIFQASTSKIYGDLKNRAFFRDPTHFKGAWQWSPPQCSSGCLFESVVNNTEVTWKTCSHLLSALPASYIPELMEEPRSYWWWSVAQSYIFRPNSMVLEHTTEMAAALDHSSSSKRAFSGHPDIAIHIENWGANAPGIAEYLDEALSWAKARAVMCPTCPPAEVFISSSDANVAESSRHWGEMHAPILSVFMLMGAESAVTKVTHGGTPSPSKAPTNAPTNSELPLVSEILFLTRARVFIGLCMSELARMVASIGGAQGNILTMVAMDVANIALVQFGEAEGWVPPGTVAHWMDAKQLRAQEIHARLKKWKDESDTRRWNKKMEAREMLMEKAARAQRELAKKNAPW